MLLSNLEKELDIKYITLRTTTTVFLALGMAFQNIHASEPGYSPYVDQPHPTQVFWGDTHLHTTNSTDARALGVQLGVADAYRFARGEQLDSSSGLPVRLSRPLDFLVVSDHSDSMGVMDKLVLGDAELLKVPEFKRLYEMLMKGGESAKQALYEYASTVVEPGYTGPLLVPEITKSVWERYVETADEYNDPGRFTAMIGYEWTPTAGGDKLHRNVLYRGDADTARKMMPFTSNDSVNPQDLWQWMQRYEETTGGQVLALAHSGNLSNGKMFPVETNPNTRQAIDNEYVRSRARWEPLYEVTQIKGDGESHPYLSPQDEFADFETWDRGNVLLTTLKTPEMLQYEYAREALKNGLKLEQTLEANPYKFGMVGSTDSHTALATAEEDNFFGKMSNAEPGAERMNTQMAVSGNERMWKTWETSASGYAAVWAEDNTREAIWDAMYRKEVYATSGPRITVRFFGGWEFSSQDAASPNLAKIGYSKGVPMGGTLQSAGAQGENEPKSPSFLIAASKDPLGANLDRIQVIKGWVDARGDTHEHVYNVAASDGRKIDKNVLGPVGNTVDISKASYQNSIGDAELSIVWQDPNFDPSQSAVYYARVIEIPTPRWTAYDARRYGVDTPDGAKSVLQERAYTSPIWFQP